MEHQNEIDNIVSDTLFNEKFADKVGFLILGFVQKIFAFLDVPQIADKGQVPFWTKNPFPQTGISNSHQFRIVGQSSFIIC